MAGHLVTDYLMGLTMILQSVLGLAVFIILCWLISEKRSMFPAKLVIAGLALQLCLAVLLLKVPIFRKIFLLLNQAVLALEQATRAGTTMVFGYLGGGPLPFAEPYPGSAYVFAFRALPLILLISALSSLLFYWGVLPRIVKFFSLLFRKSLGIGGAEGLGVAANIFVGMVESPLFIRPYLERMSRSELFTVMTCGMSTIAGTVMVLYASILGPQLPEIMGHILTASLISAPAAVVVAKIIIPETDSTTDAAALSGLDSHGSLDAITQGTIQGVQLLIHIVAMMIVMVALIELCNTLLGFIPTGGEHLSLQRLFGILLAPVTWLIGIPWSESFAAGALFGTKTVINEFLAYLNMSQLPAGTLSERSLYIMTYALCGFANPGSVGIMIGGMGAMAPQRRHEIVSLGLKSLVAGTIATSMTAAIAALLI